MDWECSQRKNGTILNLVYIIANKKCADFFQVLNGPLSEVFPEPLFYTGNILNVVSILWTLPAIYLVQAMMNKHVFGKENTTLCRMKLKNILYWRNASKVNQNWVDQLLSKLPTQILSMNMRMKSWSHVYFSIPELNFKHHSTLITYHQSLSHLQRETYCHVLWSISMPHAHRDQSLLYLIKCSSL